MASFYHFYDVSSIIPVLFPRLRFLAAPPSPRARKWGGILARRPGDPRQPAQPGRSPTGSSGAETGRRGGNHWPDGGRWRPASRVEVHNELRGYRRGGGGGGGEAGGLSKAFVERRNGVKAVEKEVGKRGSRKAEGSEHWLVARGSAGKGKARGGGSGFLSRPAEHAGERGGTRGGTQLDGIRDAEATCMGKRQGSAGAIQ